MAVSFRITHDDISPDLSKLARTARSPQRVFRAMGNTFLSITMGNFRQDTSYRPAPWPAKRDGSASFLMLHNVLSRSFHLEATDEGARVSNPTVYAAIHQFGGVIKPKSGKALRFQYAPGQWAMVKSVKIPARPFYPVTGSPGNYRLTDRAAEKIKRAGERIIEIGAQVTPG